MSPFDSAAGEVIWAALRKAGDMNLFLDAYGYVEVGHLAPCHAILDYSMQWAGSRRAVARA